MPKKKQKTAKAGRTAARTKTTTWSPVRFAGRFKNRPLMAGLAVALVAVPASWMMVSAQSPDSGLSPLGVRSGSSSSSAADTTDSASGSKGSNARQADASKKTSSKDSKAGTSDSKKSGSGASSISGSATGGGATTGTAAAPPASTSPAPPVTPPAGLHANITTTIFWVGEAAGPDNAGISNAESAWDGNWQVHYGGFDDPDHRNGYYPTGFTPSENPFYFALPYNDLDDNGDRKATANSCPNVGGSVSWCKNAWIKIVKGGKTAYAQWEDVGPLKEDDVAYVFGTAAPANTWGAKAGLDVSPAVRDYMGLSDVDKVSWTFVSASEVPAGPWKQIITTSPGGW